MASYIDFPRLAKLVKAKRGDRGLREVAEEIGDISPSTLSRIEGERVNDVASSTLLRICDWLDIAPSELIKNAGDSPPPDIDVPSAVDLQLRADKTIDATMARMLAEMFKAAYREAKKSSSGENSE
jgi:DNA-binding Xre family transcriptional regulator